MNYLMSVEGFGAEPPPAPIPLLPMVATPLPPPPATPITINPIERPKTNIPAMPVPLPFMEEDIPRVEAPPLPLPFMQEELPTAKLADVDSPIETIAETPFDLKATDLTSLTENLDIRKPEKRQPASPMTFAELYSQTGAAEEPAKEPPTPPLEFRQEFEKPEPPAKGRRGGRRPGAGRPRDDFKSNTELRRLLKNEYGIVGTSKLPTNALRAEVIKATGNRNIIYKD